uniref:Phosphoglycerate mutase family protein n=1 Tax=Trichuris muris TaxID=70415 RepID=A0A5S6QEP9_TRIMR
MVKPTKRRSSVSPTISKALRQQHEREALMAVLENERPSTSRNNVMTAHRRVIIMRHGERCDDVYSDFVQRGFDKDDTTFKRFDLNMPDKLAQRHEQPYASKIDWQTDPPLSNMGHKTAAAVGAEFAHLKAYVDYVYSSPSIRCVQTASRFVEGFEKVVKRPEKLKVRVEGGLFEWLFNSGCVNPRFLNESDLAKGGLPVDLNYKCYLHGNKLQYNETFEEFNERGVQAIRHIMKDIPTGSTVLMVTHAPNFDLFNKYRGTGGTHMKRWHYLVSRVPYLYCIMYDEVSPNKWEMKPPPVCSFPYDSNDVYNWNNPGKP